MAIFSGDIFAENYTVSSSVTNVQISSVSGSTKSGDSSDDIHQFTGSIKSTGAIITDNLVRVDVLDGLWFNGGGSSTFSPSPYIGYTSSPTGTGWFWQLPNNGTEKFSYKLGATEASRQFRIVGPNWESSAIITGDGRLALGADKFELTDNPSSQLHISGSDSLSLVRVENSGDKLFEITGSQISGSSTSTGSFGRMEIASAYGPKAVISVQDGIDNGGLRLQGSTRATNQGSYIELMGGNYAYGSAVFNYGYDQTNSELSFQTNGSERILFGGLGKITARTIELTGQAFSESGLGVSGSSSSTGSFGMLRVGDEGANLVLRTKSANISIGNMNTYPYVMDSSAGNYNVAIGTS